MRNTLKLLYDRFYTPVPMAEERSMDSFLCGFHLALEMGNELNYYKQDRQSLSVEEVETE
ncbi:hypothetical protein [Pseudoflavonifractor phocaeensis]|uniref:hypothetical protein n=1 Tax=Pseudoflavonifractor phocaeensis TaxID=1870988 RepID=UPI00195F19CF|nr:hypothetical protein [Pseudoflavonifractor phocaeensis]MBM6887887.1 hypothetical protein [Pseudoflavonifractor phocaeensis]